MEQTIYALLPLHRSHKLICCGRLDKDSEGLVILTNSGELAAKLSHPSGGLKKYYRVSLSVPLNEQHRKKMLAGVTCDGEVLRAQGIEFSEKSHRRPHITLEEGRKRHIRRMMEAFGYEIQRLERYRIGQFSMGTIRPGRHMELTDEHLRKLQCN
jgi:23S rRNA pseudouridine2605 synthase